MTTQRPWAARAAVSAFVLLAACSGRSPEQYMASARDYIERADFPAAVIQARNAVKAEPERSEARLLLGTALLKANDPVAADSEFRKALALGAPRDTVLPLLAQALLGSGRADVLVREFADKPPAETAARAQFDAALGDAYSVLRRRDEAARAYRAALAADPGGASARLGLAQLEAQAGRLDAALRATDAVIAEHPKSAQALALKSDILLAQGDAAAAKRALEQAVQADPAYLPARYALIAALVDEGTVDSAREHLAFVSKASPNDIRLAYFQAALALRTGDLPFARDRVGAILKAVPDHVPALVLASKIETQSGQLASAEAHLRRALAQAPNHAEARRLLVATLLQSGQAARARQDLQPLLASKPVPDAHVLLLAGEVSMASGDVKQATAYFRQAAERGRKTEAAAAHTRLGQIAMAAGRQEDGERELEAAADADPSFRRADMALIHAYLRQGDTDRALAAARALEKKDPKDATAHQVLGSVHLAKRDRASARASFERALALDPGSLAAARALANLDLADGKADAARRRYERMLEHDRRNASVHLALAQLQLRSGASPGEVATTLRSAVASDPSSVEARLALVSALARAGDTRGALTAAQEANSALPNRVPVLQALAALQAEVGDQQQSRETLRRLAQLQPGQPAALQRVAAVQAGQKQFDAAVATLRLAKETAPNDLGVRRDLIVLYLTAARPEDALAEARAVQSAVPGNAAGWLLESQVHETQRRFDDAERALRQGLKLEPDSGVIAARLHGVLAAAGRGDEAAKLERKWVAEHPKDVVFRTQLAERDLATKDYKEASAHYQAVLAVDPNSVVALNNLAWIGGQTNDPKALQYAERAVKLAPDSAAVLDTMGMLLVAKGEARRGVEYLGRAARIAPARTDIRLNYAKALVQAGRKDEAKRELEALQAAPRDFPGKTEVASLLKSL